MKVVFDTDSYEYDLALAMLDTLVAKGLCNIRQYDRARKIMKEGDVNGTTDNTATLNDDA